MRFTALVALAVVASTVPSLAAPAPYSPRRVASKRDTASTDDNTFVGASPRIGTVVLPGAKLSLDSKRDAASDFVQVIEAAFSELTPARKRDITTDITAALQTLLQAGGSVLSDVNLKREADSILPVEERSWIPKLSSIAGAFDSSNSTRRNLDQFLDEANVDGASGGGVFQIEDRSFTIPSSVSSILGKAAGIVSAGGTATIISALDSSSNITKRELGMESGRVHDQRRAVPSDIESILQQIIASFEGTTGASGSTSVSTSTSTKRSRTSTSDNNYFDRPY